MSRGTAIVFSHSYGSVLDYGSVRHQAGRGLWPSSSYMPDRDVVDVALAHVASEEDIAQLLAETVTREEASKWRSLTHLLLLLSIQERDMVRIDGDLEEIRHRSDVQFQLNAVASLR